MSKYDNLDNQTKPRSVDRRGKLIGYRGMLLQNKSHFCFARGISHVLFTSMQLPDVFPLKVKLCDNNFFEFNDTPNVTITHKIIIQFMYNYYILNINYHNLIIKNQFGDLIFRTVIILTYIATHSKYLLYILERAETENK